MLANLPKTGTSCIVGTDSELGVTWHKWWGAAQWAAYLEHMELPVKATSKQALADLVATRGDWLAPLDLANLMLDDPLFALRLLKDANQHLPRHMARDITTPLGVVLALGTRRYSEQIDQAPVIGADNLGFFACEARYTQAARIAQALGNFHHDTDPAELALATLLANAGEIELWAFAPELPQAALDVQRNGGMKRNEDAEIKACGFAFKDLTLLMCEHWQLPPLILQLIRGDQTIRAKLALLAVDMSRHLANGNDDQALADDLEDAAQLTGATLTQLLGSLPGYEGFTPPTSSNVTEPPAS